MQLLEAGVLRLQGVHVLQLHALLKLTLVPQQCEWGLPGAGLHSDWCGSLGAEGTCEGAPWVFWADCHRVSSWQQASSSAPGLAPLQASEPPCQSGAAPAVAVGQSEMLGQAEVGERQHCALPR